MRIATKDYKAFGPSPGLSREEDLAIARFRSSRILDSVPKIIRQEMMGEGKGDFVVEDEVAHWEHSYKNTRFRTSSVLLRNEFFTPPKVARADPSIREGSIRIYYRGLSLDIVKLGAWVRDDGERRESANDLTGRLSDWRWFCEFSRKS
jgi:hypothetical protein